MDVLCCCNPHNQVGTMPVWLAQFFPIRAWVDEDKRHGVAVAWPFPHWVARLVFRHKKGKGSKKRWA